MGAALLLTSGVKLQLEKIRAAGSFLNKNSCAKIRLLESFFLSAECEGFGVSGSKTLLEEHELLQLDAAWKELGCDLESPFMTMALLPLAALPDLRLTNRGLIRARRCSFSKIVMSCCP